MPDFAISPVSGSVSPVSGPMPTDLISRMIEDTGPSTDGGVFAGVLGNAVESLSDRQEHASELGVRAITGDLENVHEYTIAATEAQVALELTAALRNKAVDAFNEIMRMQA